MFQTIPATGFTPTASLVGGILIGLASAILLLLNGRIAGISGILGGVLERPTVRQAWRWCFLLGLPLGALLAQALLGPVAVELTDSSILLVAAGALVGLGTRIGSGCTSGHGICGLARLSRRSVVATATFMGTAALVVYLTGHVL